MKVSVLRCFKSDFPMLLWIKLEQLDFKILKERQHVKGYFFEHRQVEKKSTLNFFKPYFRFDFGKNLISRDFSSNFTSRSRVIFISLSILEKEWKPKLFTSRIKVKAYFFHFSFLELFKPTLAGACYMLVSENRAKTTRIWYYQSFQGYKLVGRFLSDFLMTLMIIFLYCNQKLLFEFVFFDI